MQHAKLKIPHRAYTFTDHFICLGSSDAAAGSFNLHLVLSSDFRVPLTAKATSSPSALPVLLYQAWQSKVIMVDPSSVRGVSLHSLLRSFPFQSSLRAVPALLPLHFNGTVVFLHFKPIFLQPISIPAVKKSTDSQSSGCKILPARRSFAQLVNLQASLQATLPSDVQPGTTLRPTVHRLQGFQPLTVRRGLPHVCLPVRIH